MKTSILTRLLFLLLISYIPVSVIILRNNQIQYEQAEQNVQAHALQQARDIAFFYSQQILEVEHILLLLTKISMIQNWDMPLCNETVGDIVATFPGWAALAVMDAEATVVCSNVTETIGVNYADRDFVREVYETKEMVVSDLIVGRVTGVPGLVVAMPIFEADGSIRGTINVGIMLTAQSEIIASTVLRPDYRMTIIDQNNAVVMAYPEPERWIGSSYQEDLLEKVGNQEEGTFETIGLESQTRLYGFTRLEDLSAIVLVSIDKSLAFAEVNSIQQRNFGVLVAAFFVASMVVMAAAWLIARPLRQFSVLTQQFAGGDLSTRIDTQSGVSEVIMIQQAFNNMAGSIEARIEERTTALKNVNMQLAAEIETRKAIEADLARNTERLRESNQDLEHFAFVASHDLREPLRKISTFSSLLQRDSISAEQRSDYLKRMQDAAERMMLMIDNLLLFARIDNQHNTQVEFDLSALVQQVVGDLDALIKEKQASVEIFSLPSIRADRLQMYRLFQNLISNALKFHRDGVTPVVRIVGKEDAEGFQIRIEDNGIGIDEKDRDRIFKIFERLHGRGEGGGAGLGLAICRKIVLQHNGKIWVESTLGTGSTFVLSFPNSIKAEPKQ
jgi:signal transduction histidine kinase